MNSRGKSWSEDEKQKFNELLKAHGRDFEKISAELGTRTVEQCRRRVNLLKTRMRTGVIAWDTDLYVHLSQEKTKSTSLKRDSEVENEDSDSPKEGSNP